MNKRIAIRIGLMLAAVAILFSGCIIFIDPDIWANWNADLKVVAEWDGGPDIDLRVSFPDPDDDNTTNDLGNPEFIDLYDDFLEVEDRPETAGDPGFFLYDVNFRQIVDSDVPKSSFTADGAASVELTAENNEDGEEVVIIRRAPFENTNLTYQSNLESNKGFASNTDYAWIGVTEVYVEGNGTSVTAVDLEVSIYNGNDDLLMSFTMPGGTSLPAMSVARIHHFLADNGSSVSDYYVIVPDQKTIAEANDYRSAGGDITIGDGVVGTFGTVRE